MDEREEEQRRHYEAPYNKKHPIPSIQRFRDAKEVRRAHALDEDEESEDKDGQELSAVDNPDEDLKDTSELQSSGTIKDKRKTLQKRKDDRIERIVTDPVTHLPVKIHDFTSESLQSVAKNDPAYGTTPRTATGLSNKEKSNDQLRKELEEIARGQAALQAEFPPPAYQQVHSELVKISYQSTILGTAGATCIITGAIAIITNLGSRYIAALIIAIAIVLTCSLIYGISNWADRRTQSLWDAAVWQGKFNKIKQESEEHETETTVWLNSLLSSVWPLINPDLFTSLADTLEDVMQASLPSVVRMVSVDDIGQGSEALRILGVRWLPTGAAARAVSDDGKLETDLKRHDSSLSQPEEKQMTEGMAAEEGDFINLEIAFAYRASSSGSTFKDRMKDMHIYLAFYLPGNLKLPVWVDLRGAVGVMRLRLQLAPDPPFFGLCTFTLLGQPKIELSCVPLIKSGLNLMNLPVLKSFVQSSIDAAMAEYVAPKSLTLDLKDMIAGDDFKKDVVAHGVLMVEIIRGYDFEIGDMGIPLIKNGSADPYVTVGWAKFSKPLWSTRILENEMEPIWNETTYILITPDELNVDERLRLQLWDSDRFTADDDLGRIEVDIKQLMNDVATNGKMMKRTDGFRALKAGEGMPGKLEWRVGYFLKLSIQKDQLARQTVDKDTTTLDKLQEKADEIGERKLREMQVKEGRSKKAKAELEQQRKIEFKDREEAMMIDAPPPQDYHSGIFSIQIHQITGLELQNLHAEQNTKESKTIDNENEQDDLPSAYCTVILNHTKVYKTRTKPKNARPFFNAGTERFIGDWRSAEVHVSVRDAKVHEDDSLLGIVHLPLSEVFKDRSQVNGYYPISGGVGYGRIRLSMVWRSVKLQAPRELTGWQLGTLEIASEITGIDLPDSLHKMKLKLRTNLSTAKMSTKDQAGWQSRKGKKLHLAVHDRYSSCFTVRFRAKGITGNKTEAFAVMWLKDIPDEEDKEMTLPIWQGDFHKAIKSSLSDCGDKVGSIKIHMTFWSGLGSAHTKWAVKNANMRDVVQVLETAHDNLETTKAEQEAGIVDEDNNSDSDSDSDEDDRDKENIQPETGDDKKGALSQLTDEVKDYKDNYKSIHRRNRGIMTWKAPRTAQWAFHSAERVEHKLAGIFKRHSRGISIETEV